MDLIGDFLKKLRGKMPLREAAERSGLSHSYIRYLEMGKRPGTNTPINPTPESLRGLAKAYNYSYSELMKLAGYNDGIEEENNNPELDTFKSNMLDDFSRLSKEDQEYIMGLIKRLPKE